MVAQNLCPVRQPALPGPQGLGKGVEVVALLPELVELSAHLVEGAIPVAGAEFQLLPPALKESGSYVFIETLQSSRNRHADS
jgi:hypothetical protein